MEKRPRIRKRNLDRDVEILKKIALEGKLTAYRAHKITGYPLTSVQYSFKTLKELGFIDQVEHQVSGLEKKLYDVTFMGSFFLIASLDKLGLTKFLEIIERGAKTDKRKEDDLFVSAMKTAVKMDMALEKYEKARVLWEKKFNVHPHDFTVSTAAFLFAEHGIEETADIYAGLTGEFASAMMRERYLEMVNVLYEPPLEREEDFLSKLPLRLVLWKSGFFDKMASQHIRLGEELKRLSKEVKESWNKEIKEMDRSSSSP